MKAVIFDMDGVLFDTEKIYDEAWRRAARIMDFDAEPSIIACKGTSTAGCRAWYAENLPGVDFDRFDALQTEQYDIIVREEGLPEKKGLHNIMNALSARGIRIALASSTASERVLAHLDKAGIKDMFEVIVTGDKIRRSKPAPDIYLAALDSLGLEGADCVAIEDSFNGIRSAHDAGIPVIMVPDTQIPTAEITALTAGVYPDLDAALFALCQK